MTTRERRERRAERLREWADKRDAKARAARQASDRETEQIPFGQPILVGHHSQRRHERALERADRNFRRAAENANKADDFRSRAGNIEAQADRAIYSDDTDAEERLRERIAEMEEERARIKRYNASCRKAAKSGGTGDLSILTEAEREDLLTIARVASYQLRDGGAMPSYTLTNLGGNIRRLKKRLEGLGREPVDRIITARYGGTCEDCGADIERGQSIRYSRAAGARCAPSCAGQEG